MAGSTGDRVGGCARCQLAKRRVSCRKTRRMGLAAMREPFRGDFRAIIAVIGSSGRFQAARRLLHSRCAFGIALPVAGERSPPISRMRV
jgi:hypothetical protein